MFLLALACVHHDPLEAAGDALVAGRLRRAERLFERALRADPTQISARYGLAVVGARRCDDDCAEVCSVMEALQREAPGYRRLYYQLALCELDRGRGLEAEGWLNRAALVHPDDPDVLWLRAFVRRQLGDVEGACADRDRARALGVDDLVFPECSERPVVVASPLSGGSPDTQIRSMYQTFRAAIVRGDGRAAIPWVDASTPPWLASLVDDALDAPRASLESRELYDVLRIVHLRLAFSRSELQQLRGDASAALLAAAPWGETLGWIAISELGRVEVTSETNAWASWRGHGEDVPRLRFVLEEGGWKMDLADLRRRSGVFEGLQILLDAVDLTRRLYGGAAVDEQRLQEVLDHPPR